MNSARRSARGSFTLLLPAALILLIPGPQSALAQGPQGHIASIYPAGAQRGQTVEVTVQGTDLEGAQELRVTGDGVSGKVLNVQKGDKAEKSEKGDKAITVQVSVTVDADAPLGLRDLRLITKGGVTNRARFVVGQLPEVAEREPNSELGKAQSLSELPVVVNGQVFEADKDLFRFSARKGQTIVCQVQAQQLLPFIADAVPGWFQPVLTLSDAAGHTLARVDDFRFHPDPVLIQPIEQNGDYVLELRDSIFRGRDDFVYRLTVGDIPFVTHVYPLGGQRKSTVNVDLFGVNLPKRSVKLSLAEDSPSLLEVASQRGATVTNALPFAVGDLAETQEAEPNDTREKLQAVSMPIAINGRIQAPGDIDCFQFAAEAGQSLALEVFARRLDSPLDSLLTLLDADGATVAKNDDADDPTHPQITHHADSRLVHKFKSGGQYTLRLADVQGKGGPEYAYRLVLAPPQPDFELRIVPDNPRVGQGSTTVLTVSALRRAGFDGQIDLSIERLPKGFSTTGLAIAEGATETLLTLTAPADAPLGIHQPRIIGQATIGERTVRREALPAEDVMQAFIYHHLLPTQEFLLSVIKPGPFKLIPQVPPEGYIRFGSGRTAYLEVKVVRTPAAKGTIRLALSNPPKGIRMKSVSIAPNEDHVKCEITYPNKSPSGIKYHLIISGSLKAGDETLTTITPAFLVLGPGAKAPVIAKPAKKPSGK